MKVGREILEKLKVSFADARTTVNVVSEGRQLTKAECLLRDGQQMSSVSE